MEVTDHSKPRTALVLGGARSGKSTFAERLAEQTGLQKVYVATSAAFDTEMEERIGTHRHRRGPSWITIEEQLNLKDVLLRESAPDRVILADCLTLWLSNLTFSGKDIGEETAALCETVAHLKGPCIFVSNEVGLGIVPENRLSRSFRDAQGRLNQDMAEVCTQVVFLAAGQPLLLKPRTQPDITL
ncbi:bifunctional adenosylcobinamide kinase/adenosylcobinamide-phosphate guanylyltransferase [Roseibium sp.]|uniref:bifunctional adenosylcobinamide kinase/adenosylcobinamide-phosphate guanylyltransferase n=1 Tax=Roseibium sp. TaxID=1936156 RepID=UPI003BAF70CB